LKPRNNGINVEFCCGAPKTTSPNPGFLLFFELPENINWYMVYQIERPNDARLQVKKAQKQSGAGVIPIQSGGGDESLRIRSQGDPGAVRRAGAGGPQCHDGGGRRSGG
jgi:hypothetical protein